LRTNVIEWSGMVPTIPIPVADVHDIGDNGVSARNRADQSPFSRSQTRACLAVGDPENKTATEYAQTLQTVTTATLLFIDLWRLLPHVPHPADPDQFTQWRVAVQEQALKLAPGPAYGFRSSPAGIADS
jgi:hypothetical protein